MYHFTQNSHQKKVWLHTWTMCIAWHGLEKQSWNLWTRLASSTFKPPWTQSCSPHLQYVRKHHRFMLLFKPGTWKNDVSYSAHSSSPYVDLAANNNVHTYTYISGSWIHDPIVNHHDNEVAPKVYINQDWTKASKQPWNLLSASWLQMILLSTVSGASV